MIARSLSKLELGVKLEAIIALAIASVASRTLPFKVYIEKGAIQLRRERETNARAIARIVDALADRVPFRSVCLQRGLALQWMLRRRGFDAILHYGIQIAPGGLGAHVWVSLDGDVLIGAPAHKDFTEVAKYPCSKKSELANTAGQRRDQ